MNAASRWRVYPKLGRVSNLPTIATQTVAAALLPGRALDALDAILLGCGFVAAYTAGMFLNDAFDREIDAVERPDRPIAAGLTSAREVFGAGTSFLALGVACLALAGTRRGFAFEALCGALGLGAMIVIYDAWHKKNAFAPLVMAACRALVYVAASLSLTGRVTPLVMVAALAMAAYVTGLSDLSREPRSRPRSLVALVVAPVVLGALAVTHSITAVPFVVALALVIALAWLRAGRTERDRATVLLISGLSLVDAALLAIAGHPMLAVVAAVAVPLTRALQSVVRGT